MIRHVAGLAGMVCVVGLAFGAPDPKLADLEKLQGTWIMSSIELDGKVIPAPEGGGTLIISKDMKMVMKEKGKPDDHSTFKIDATTKPKQIDLMGENKEKKKEVVQGIYTLDGDTFTIVLSAKGPTGDRPTSLKQKATMAMVFKRAKK
jgi:uncharacterized protein (TIGR03067 family)